MMVSIHLKNFLLNGIFPKDKGLNIIKIYNIPNTIDDFKNLASVHE